jgi:sporulation protein YlmC with PRC-barrel domain
MNIKNFYAFFILIFLNTSLLSKDLSFEEFNELKKALKNNDVTIEQFNETIDEFEISSEIFKISKDLFLNNAIELDDYLVVIENSLVSVSSSNSNNKENETNNLNENSNNIFDGEFLFQTEVTKLSKYITDMKYGQLFDNKIIFENNKIKKINISENNENVLKFTKPKLTILDNGKFYIKSNVIDPKDPSPLKYRLDGQIDKNLISGKIQIIYNGSEMPGMVLLELETIEKSVLNNNSNNIMTDLTDNKLSLKFKITEVNNRVPSSLNARVDNIENLTFVIEEDQVKEILFEEKSNNFFSKKIVKSFKNIKIKLTNQTTLKGKSKLVLNELRGENVVIWWDLNLSQNNLSGEVEIELVGKGPQIRLIPVNE